MKTLVLVTMAALLLAPAAFALPPQVAINESDYQCPGTDATEWVELVGTAGTDLAGWSLVFLNQTGTVYTTVTFPVNSIIPNDFTSYCGGDGGFFVVGIFDAATEAAFPGECDYTPPGWTTNEIQNGPDDIIQLWDPTGTFYDEWQYDSDAPGAISITGLSQTFGAYDSAGTDGDWTTYSSIGRIGYSYDQPLFVFDMNHGGPLCAWQLNDTFDHEVNVGSTWTPPGVTEANGAVPDNTPEIQWSGTYGYANDAGITPGTFNYASYGSAGRQDPFTINIIPEPATIGLMAFAGLALLRRRR